MLGVAVKQEACRHIMQQWWGDVGCRATMQHGMVQQLEGSPWGI